MTKTQFDDNFVQLPRGSFLMGSDDPIAKEREKPLHEVHIDYDVAMSKRQVTVEDYMLFAQATGAEVPVDRHENLGFDVPVRRVRFHDAKAYCEWKTQRESKTYRLPTEAEWEYAARGGLESASYPWGGPYTKNDRGCFMANFKPLRGDYAADQALYTVEAHSYEPNDYGLYNMAGNVSEWVFSSYDPGSYEYSSSMNPSVNDEENMKKVVRGGSWKDVAYFLQVSSRDYEYADTARSYIGFRTVQDYLGTDVTLNQTR